ncbi:hypothetical protein HK101_004453 [Irineochytrium annulatum]|nr:hypothetical protein HK101_004453 [Irineochytrium annulatum]
MADALSTDPNYSGDEIGYLLLRNPLSCYVLYKLAYYSLYYARNVRSFFHKAANEIDDVIKDPSNLFIKATNMFFSTKFPETIPLILKFFDIAKLRAEIGYQHYAMGYLCSQSFQMGRYDFIQTTVRSMYEATETIKDDPVFTFHISYGFYRAALVAGDARAISEWRPIFEATEPIAQLLKSSYGAGDGLKAWVELLDGNSTAALAHLEDCIAVLPAVDAIDRGGVVMHVVQSTVYVIILMADQSRSGAPFSAISSDACMPSSWKAEDVTRLRALTARLFRYAKAIAAKCLDVFCFWTAELFQICNLVLAGVTKKAVKVAKAKLTCKRRLELDNILALKAFYYGFIAKYSHLASERTRHKVVSRELLQDLKSSIYLQWLDA